MKIIPNLIQGQVSVNKYHQAFGQTTPVVAQYPSVTQTEIPGVVPRYSISAPIAYSHVEDIKLPNDLTAHCYKLANGQRVVIVPKEGATVVKTYVNTGSLNEPDNVRGISHYIEHNLFNGSEALGDKDFFDEVNKMGAETNASTSFSVTDYYIKSNLLEDNDLENKIKLQAGMLQTPKFLNEKLAKEKKIVDSEINMCLSDDGSRAETITLKNLFNIKSTSPDLVAGSTDNIDNLTRDDVVNYFNNNYYPTNMVTVITGEVEPNQTMSLVSKYFNSTKTGNAPRYYETMTPIDKPVRYDMISQKTQGGAKIIMAFAGPENGNEKDKVYLRAVNELFFGLAGARMQKVEQKYSTEIFGGLERMGTRTSDKSALLMETSVPENYVEPLLKDIYGVITDVVNNPPSKDEFDAIKNSIKKTNSVYLQSSKALNAHIGADFLNGTPYLTANYASIIDNMSYADFMNTARKYYDLNKVALTVVHPVGTTENSIENNYSKVKTSQLAFTGSMKKVPIDINKISEYTMANNFDVTLQDKDTDVINYSLVVDTKQYNPVKAAVSDVLEDMLQNCGSLYRTKDQFDALLDKNAIDTGMSSGNRSLSVFADSGLDKAGLALDVIKEKLTAPNLSEEVFKQAIQHCRDSYMTVEPNASEDFRTSIYKNTSRGVALKDKLESLDSITLDDVKQLYSQILANGQGRIVVTAPFSKHPELKNMVFNSIASYSPVAPKDVSIHNSFEPIEKTQVHLTETKRNQAEVLQGFKFKHEGNVKDIMCLHILNHVLGGSPSSRLFMDLREQRHLAYAVYSNLETKDNIGVIALSIETTTNNLETGEKSFDNIKKSIDGFNENIEKLKTQKIFEEELNTAKKALKTSILSGVEMNASQTTILSGNVVTPYGINYINQKFDIIDSITSEDILNTAKYVFKNKPVYSISGTKEALKSNEEFLNSLKND